MRELPKENEFIRKSIGKIENVILNYTVHSDPFSLLSIEIYGVLRAIADRLDAIEGKLSGESTDSHE